MAQPFRACVTAQNSRGSLQPSVTSGPGSPVPSSGLLGTKHARGIYIDRQVKYTATTK